MDCIKMVVTMNPCKCGYYPDRSRCSEREVLSYLHRIIRPLLNRIDLHVEVRQMQYEELMGKRNEETMSKSVRESSELMRSRKRDIMVR